MTPAVSQRQSPAAPSLADLAREHLKQSDGDVAAATTSLQALLNKDARLLRAVVKDAVEEAVKTTVNLAHRHERSAIMRQTTAPGRNGVIALAHGVTRALLDMPLAGGIKLREATRAQVVEQAERYSTQAADMGRKSRWLTLIAQHVPEGKTVGRAITDGRAAELWASVSAVKEAA